MLSNQTQPPDLPVVEALETTIIVTVNKNKEQLRIANYELQKVVNKFLNNIVGE